MIKRNIGDEIIQGMTDVDSANNPLINGAGHQ